MPGFSPVVGIKHEGKSRVTGRNDYPPGFLPFGYLHALTRTYHKSVRPHSVGSAGGGRFVFFQTDVLDFSPFHSPFGRQFTFCRKGAVVITFAFRRTHERHMQISREHVENGGGVPYLSHFLSEGEKGLQRPECFSSVQGNFPHEVYPSGIVRRVFPPLAERYDHVGGKVVRKFFVKDFLFHNYYRRNTERGVPFLSFGKQEGDFRPVGKIAVVLRACPNNSRRYRNYHQRRGGGGKEILFVEKENQRSDYEQHRSDYKRYRRGYT